MVSSAAGAARLLPGARLLGESLKDAQINPSIVVIIIILTIIFFLSGCLHLLIRCLVMRHPRRDPNSIVTLTALQGQLQQLFHLHDSGVEQAFIDTLPVFFYKSVKGLKDSADCAVCLCEFAGDDRLRLLPKCSHAFHMECIDTWLLSHSTCPLCRRSLLPEDHHLHHLSLLQSSAALGFHGLLPDSSRTSSLDRSSVGGPALVIYQDGGNSSGRLRNEGCGSQENQLEQENANEAVSVAAGGASARHDDASIWKLLPRSMRRDADESHSLQKGVPIESQMQSGNLYAGKVVAVQLGRFKASDAAVVGTSSTSASAAIGGSRRSYSVGSYEYVLDPSNLEVFIAPTPSNGRNRAGCTPRRIGAKQEGCHRITLSEYDVGCVASAGGSRRWENLRSGIFSCAAEASLDISPLLLPFPPNHRHGSRMAGPRAARLKPHDALPLALCYCTGDDSQAAVERRAFSFRHPISTEMAKLKERAGSRRSMSDVEAYPRGGRGGLSFWSGGGESEEDERCAISGEAAPLSSGRQSSSETASVAAARESLAKRTLSWLIGSSR